MESTEEKKVYYTGQAVNFMSRQLQGRSLIASSVDPGPPWVRYDPQRHGVAYFAFDCDERRQQLG